MIVPVPALTALVPQSFTAFTVIPEAGIDPAEVAVIVIVRVEEVPLNPEGRVHT